MIASAGSNSMSESMKSRRVEALDHRVGRSDVSGDVDRRRTLRAVDSDAESLETAEAMVAIELDESSDGDVDDVPFRVETPPDRQQVFGTDGDGFMVFADPVPFEEPFRLFHSRRYGPPSAENSAVRRPHQLTPTGSSGPSVSSWMPTISGISSRYCRGNRAECIMSDP